MWRPLCGLVEASCWLVVASCRLVQMLWFVAYPHNSAHTLILSANKKKKDISMFGPKIDLRAFHSLGVAYDHTSLYLHCTRHHSDLPSKSRMLSVTTGLLIGAPCARFSLETLWRPSSQAESSTTASVFSLTCFSEYLKLHLFLYRSGMWSNRR